MSDVTRQIREYLLEDRGGIVFETSGSAVAQIEAHLAQRGLLDDSGVLTKLDRSRSMVDRLAAECDVLETERDDALLRLERALAELTAVKDAASCWRCGGTA